MIRFIGATIVICALAILVCAVFPVGFYSKPGYQRLAQLWTQDLERIKEHKTFGPLLGEVRAFELHYSDPQVASELEALVVPLVKNPNGKFLVRIEIIRWIDGHHYGYVLQHNFFDLTLGEHEKVHEFGRTYQVGIFW